ncbi:hypothetical protein O0I10_005705 [Lichtheimia ornata]|uniref:Uncharacterized protein n=1 Tax=Lichtheimia ornata TaxID=688661 RepID=A0AAD7V5J4_9FUNG|nr:uncharacterized protein O0I10_005705 [Lichtheimia ornata]KAJ8658665.1 hypothetical protein O0I10_005705 [Lichtheimia ornata]
MKLSFVAFAATIVPMSGFVGAAVCDNPTKVDRCDNKKCTFDVFHYPLDKDGVEDTYKRSCVLHDDSVKCHEQFNHEEECLANQCVWEYYRRKHKEGGWLTVPRCVDNLPCDAYGTPKTKEFCESLDYCRWNEKWGCIERT